MKMPRWPVEAVAYLVTHYPFTDTAEIAAHLGRTPSSVRTVARRLKVAKAKAPKPEARPRGRPRGSGVPDGRLRTRSGYQYIKIGNVWRLHHRALWEQAFGPVPPGHVVAFQDGNAANVSLTNLQLVAKADWLQRYGVNALPPELAALVRTRAALVRLIRGRDE